MLITVEDTENRAKLKLQRAVDEVQKLLVPVSFFLREKLISWKSNRIIYIAFCGRPFDLFILQQAEGEDELKKRQLMELAIINGTYRDSSSKSSAAGETSFSSKNVVILC